MKIYADNAATTKLDIDAFEAMKPYLLEDYANPSQTYSFSRKVKRALKEARETIAECINAEPEEIFFTSGGTESNNWAVKCFAPFSDIRYVITSAIEHHAILNACRNGNCIHMLIPVDQYGQVKKDELIKILDRPRETVASCESTLVSVMTANNEIGTIQSIKELAEITHSRDAVFHTDAVQAIGHIPIDVKDMNIDMLSASAHKFNGPKGIGFLYSKHKRLFSFHNGGAQESGMRAGTENLPAIIGMAVALKKNIIEMEMHKTHLNKLTSLFISVLQKANIDYILNGHPTNRLPGNINISIRGKSGESLMHILDLKGIYISTGSACDSVHQQVSHVIKAINVSNDYAEGTMRITFGKNNSENDSIEIAKTIIKVLSIT